MIVTEMKPAEEISGMLEGAKSVFVLCCGGCPEGCESGGLAKGRELAASLAEQGKEVTGTAEIEFLCNKALSGIKLGRHGEALGASDAILILSCGIGVQAVAAMSDIPALPAMNTISMGARQGLWPGAERCRQCGDCMLDVTGGICPITSCSKSLVNGTCGGTNDGMCEVDPGKPCGWLEIYKRLDSLGRTDAYRKFRPPRDHRKYEFPEAKRHTVLYALEVAEAEEAAADSGSEGAEK
jgi:hypothetical protein